ncbi:uncharacterized protein [Ptychodera flava]|uniref:uncharacterized protein n=1 Tax=Ptychodera flava TaxID=63121 RepID=UPI00396A838F
MKFTLLVSFLVLCMVAAGHRGRHRYHYRGRKRLCTRADVQACELLLTNFTRNPDNWSEVNRSILYCEFVQMRYDCLQRMPCDHTRNIEGMELSVNEWLSSIEPGLTKIWGYGLCDGTESVIEVDFDNLCDEYYVFLNCSEHLSDYLKSRFALTCVAMLKAIPCFVTGRERCGIPQDISEQPVNPYANIAENGDCVLYYEERDPIFKKQERYRIENDLNYFTYF